MVILNPYLSFRGTAREAMTYYQSVLGGELVVTTFSEFPDMLAEGDGDLVMHSQLTTPDGLTLMASDTPASMEYQPPAGISLSVSGDDADKLQGFWDALAADGTVVMPYEVPPWGGRYGMVRDRFGVDWQIISDV